MSTQLALVPESAPTPSASLTAKMRKAIARCDRVILRFSTPTTRQSWENKGAACLLVARKEVQLRERSKMTGTQLQATVADEVEMSCEGTIRNGRGDRTRTVQPSNGCSGWVEFDHADDNLYSPEGGVWSLYSGRSSHVGAIFEMLPVGCTLRFEVRLDYHSNGYMAKAGIHGDILMLVVTHKGKTREIMLDASNCPTNSARFGW